MFQLFPKVWSRAIINSFVFTLKVFIHEAGEVNHIVYLVTVAPVNSWDEIGSKEKLASARV